MFPFLEHLDLFNQPIWLSQEEKNDPYGVFDSFFVDFQLVDVRVFLSEVAETCLSCDESPYDEGINRSNFMLYHQRLEILLEAVYLVALQNRQREPDIKENGCSVTGNDPCKD